MATEPHTGAEKARRHAAAYIDARIAEVEKGTLLLSKKETWQHIISGAIDAFSKSADISEADVSHIRMLSDTPTEPLKRAELYTLLMGEPIAANQRWKNATASRRRVQLECIWHGRIGNINSAELEDNTVPPLPTKTQAPKPAQKLVVPTRPMRPTLRYEPAPQDMSIPLPTRTGDTKPRNTQKATSNLPDSDQTSATKAPPRPKARTEISWISTPEAIEGSLPPQLREHYRFNIETNLKSLRGKISDLRKHNGLSVTSFAEKIREKAQDRLPQAELAILQEAGEDGLIQQVERGKRLPSHNLLLAMWEVTHEDGSKLKLKAEIAGQRDTLQRNIQSAHEAGTAKSAGQQISRG